MKVNKNRVKNTAIIGFTALAITSCVSSSKAQKDNAIVNTNCNFGAILQKLDYEEVFFSDIFGYSLHQ